MAEKVKDWQSSIVWVIGLIFICGMTYNNQRSMREDVTVNREDIKENTRSIHKNELVQTEINTKLGDIPDIKTDIEELKKYLMQWEFGQKKGIANGKETSN